jgi:hypothetical protein
MVTQCKNCAGQLVFDPKKQMLVCDHCGSEFKPEDFDDSEKSGLWDKKAESMNEVYGTDSEDLMDCYVYTCGSCGGEIIINGTEASTKCIFCGNSAVVFNRISKQKRPNYIIPFKLTKEEAVEAVRERFKKGFFIPKEIKNFKAENVRGIYIPYWILNCEHKASVVVQGQVSSGKSTKTVYYGREGRMSLKELPLDASKMLSDESSSRLEPFNMRGIKPFDEDYLLGFYSNISDITYGDLRRATYKRADSYFDEQVLNSVHGCSNKKIYRERHVTDIDYDNIKYAMFPAWFVTYYHKGQHNTILVNGQSGKVVCGVPWNKVLFFTLLIAAGIALTAVSFIILKPVLTALFTDPTSGKHSSDGEGKILAVIIAGAVAMFSIGIAKIRKVIKSIDLTQANAIFNFVKKRQE